MYTAVKAILTNKLRSAYKNLPAHQPLHQKTSYLPSRAVGRACTGLDWEVFCVRHG